MHNNHFQFKGLRLSLQLFVFVFVFFNFFLTQPVPCRRHAVAVSKCGISITLISGLWAPEPAIPLWGPVTASNETRGTGS